MRVLLAGIGLALAAWAPTATAQPWRYVDEDGEVHYTNDIFDLPKERRDRILKERGMRADAGAAVPVGVKPRPGRGEPPEARPAPAPRPTPKPTPRPADDETTAGMPTRPPTGADDETDRVRWKTLLREARERVADAEHARETAELEAQQTARQAVLVPSGPNLAAKAKALRKLEEARRELKAARKDLEELQEKARRAGVPPGWLR